MTYSKLQKFISSFILFSLFLSITIRGPLFLNWGVYAGSSDFYNLVSIIVDEETYTNTSAEIKRYAQDIQGTLQNTKVAIFPTPDNTPDFQIASLNEALYFEGYKGVKSQIDFTSKLVGTILVGNINVPLAYDQGKTEDTILPYTDFEDKMYIYDHKTKKYQKNPKNQKGIKSEIWHGIISPNLGSKKANIQGLKDYFDKNHDFYTGQGNFESSVLNGDNTLGGNTNYEPYVFYFDNLRENQSLNYDSFLGYKAYLENKEDIVYNRFSKKLADTIKNDSTGDTEQLLSELSKVLGPEFDASTASAGMDTSKVPDIQTRHIVDKAMKKFLEIFAKGTMGTMRSGVHNAGRYNKRGTEVNMDFVPYFVTVLDLVNDQIIKEASRELEDKIDSIVQNGLSRNIIIPTQVEHVQKSYEKHSQFCRNPVTKTKVYKNLFYGKSGGDITQAEECSMYRGSLTNGGQLVEGNRGLNLQNVQGDLALCQGTDPLGAWAGNTPTNLDSDYVSTTGILKLKNHNPQRSIYPVFDIAGAKKVSDESKTPSPLDCMAKNNYLTTIPCQYSQYAYNFSKDFYEHYRDKRKEDNTKKSIYLNGSRIAYFEGDTKGFCSTKDTYRYFYKTIPSYITHKSPTFEELDAQIKNMVTPNLPIDVNRYIDFISAKGNYQKIEYPYLFRVGVQKDQDLNVPNIAQNFENVLNDTSEKLNKMIVAENPNVLSGYDKTIYNFVKNGQYPSPNIDLLKYIKQKPKKELQIGDETKKIPYYDALAFALYWNNLRSVSAKYKFVFEQYLSDQFGREKNDFFLPKNKKLYEIAYLGATGDAGNMFIQLDPESKSSNPYAEVLSKNSKLNALLLGASVTNEKTSKPREPVFKCAPPGGVPLPDWLPAVKCWLDDMLPPRVGLSQGQCGGQALFLSDEEKEEYEQCNGDVNKNGVNDCVENNLQDAKIDLTSESDKYFYNKPGTLKGVLKNKDNDELSFLNGTDILFALQKVEGKKDESKDFTKDNVNTIFDVTDMSQNDIKNALPYVDFREQKIQTTGGQAEYSFVTKGKDANLYFRSSVIANDSEGKEVVQLKSNIIKVEVRGERLFLSSHILDNNQENLEVSVGSNSVVVSDSTNIFLVDSNLDAVDSVKDLINNASIAKQKGVFALQNIAQSGSEIPLSYPLQVKISQNGDEVLNRVVSSIDYFEPLTSLQKSGTYELEIKDSYNYSVKKEIEVLPLVPSKIKVDLGSTILKTGGNTTTNLFTLLDMFENVTSAKPYRVDLDIVGDGLVFQENNTKTLSFSTMEGFKAFRLLSTGSEGKNVLNFSVFDSSGVLLFRESRDIQTIEDIHLVAIPRGGKVKVGGGTYGFDVSLRDGEGAFLDSFNSRLYLSLPEMYGMPIQPYVPLEKGQAYVEYTTKTVAQERLNIDFQIEGVGEVFTKNITILPELPLKIDILVSRSQLEASQEAFTDVRAELKDRYGNVVFNENSTDINLDISDTYSPIITSSFKNGPFVKGVATFQIFATDFPGNAYFQVGTSPSLEQNYFEIQDGGGKLKVSGVGESVGKIQTFYLWNKDKIAGNKYNALYTTLLGADYGNIKKENYLAGSLLFDRDNRALSVTSLLNNPYETNDIVSISSVGKLEKVYDSSDLSQDIEIGVDLKNDTLGLNLFNASLNTFIGKIAYRFGGDTDVFVCEFGEGDCVGDISKTSLFLQSRSDLYSVLGDDGVLVLKDNFGSVLLTVDDTGKVKRFGNIVLKFDDSNTTDYSRLSVFDGDEEVASLGWYFVSPVIYSARDDDDFENLMGTKQKSIGVLLKTGRYGLKDSNEKHNGVFGKYIHFRDFFDSNENVSPFSASQTEGYEHFGESEGLGWKDGNKTLLHFSAGKSVGESVRDFMSFSVVNLGDPVVSLKKIPKKLPDSVKLRNFDSTVGSLVSNDDDIQAYELFDYDNDDLEDILLIKNNKYFKLLENKKGEQRWLDKGNLAYVTDLGSTDLIRTGDFSGDGFEDILFVDHDGVLALLNNYQKDFQRYADVFDLVGRVLRVEVFDMDNDGRDDIVTLDEAGGINIFYGGGTPVAPRFTKVNVSDGYGVKLSSASRNDSAFVFFDGLYQMDRAFSGQNEVPTELVDKIIFEELSYKKGENTATTFLKSEYAKSMGLTIEKNFTDKNGGFLKSGDRVSMEVFIKNTSNNTMRDILYAEKIEDIFTLDRESIVVLKYDSSGVLINTFPSEKITFDTPGIHFVLEDFDLERGEFVKIAYELKTKPMKFGFLQVGLFEDGELGNDDFGDIILKQDHKNCGDAVEIFRSQASRNYLKGLKTPVCNSDAAQLPAQIQKNTIDVNNNGIPDYIDELSDPSDLSSLKAFAQDSLGVVNNSDEYRDDVSMSDKIRSSLNEVDNLVQGVSCGFGSAGCIATPLNWAPLAPGGDPTLFGVPIGNGFKIKEGIPIFSALTDSLPTPIGPMPFIWPPISGGAGGMLGVNNPMNFIRVFVTPTLTGSLGTAICLGGPASLAGLSNPPGVAPFVPGGNCIVAATPLPLCAGDGSEGDIGSMGQGQYSGDGSFGVLNGNCSMGPKQPNVLLDSSVVPQYHSYRQTGKISQSFQTDLMKALEVYGEKYATPASAVKGDNGDEKKNTYGGGGGMYYPKDVPREPLFSVNGGGSGVMQVDVGIDFSGVGDDGDFGDILEVNQKRISPFPGFLMGWWTRQLEELVTKLTDFPTVFVVLPDFSGIFGGAWSEVSDNKGEDLSVVSNRSGIKEVYSFLSQVPLVKIEKDIINANIPWMDEATINKYIVSWGTTLDQWKNEFNRAKSEWTLSGLCDEGEFQTKEDCEEQTALGNKLLLDVGGLIHSLERNIEILKEWKRTPERLNKWFHKKEEYLEQVLCNVESISNITGDWIFKNGKRFKSWVELYVIVKAILKSWQTFVDVFLDYEAGCHDCKNERSDLIGFQFKLIDAVIPKIPVIQFPKWPDIMLDLHNIRAGLTITLPEFSLSHRPVLLPPLPNLILPDVPNLNVDLSIPKLDILPQLVIPDLPDLPTLPSVELPNLPPPPMLPNIFAQFEGVLNIVKLITKIMCILKSSPFVPEWRAGDQIAYLTERKGYLSFDFFDVSLPQYSYPFVDAVKVTSYLNFDFATSYISELSRSFLSPINNLTNNLYPLIKGSVSDLDFSNVVPRDIDVSGDGVEFDGKKVYGDDKEAMHYKDVKDSSLARSVGGLWSDMNGSKDVRIGNTDFKKKVMEELASPLLTSEPKMDVLRDTWDDVNNLVYSKEDKLIRDLASRNEEKFSVVEDILNTEIIKNKEKRSRYSEFLKNGIVELSYMDDESDVTGYNNKLQASHDQFMTSVRDLLDYNGAEKDALQETGEKILDTFVARSSYDNQLAMNSSAEYVSGGQNTCQAQSQSEYRYQYEGIYVMEDEVSYRLFDYLGELEGDERLELFDYDNDSDEDLLYLVNNQLYLKENLSVVDEGSYVSTPPMVLSSALNRFYSEGGDGFYESVNNFGTAGVESGAMSIRFSPSSREGIHNYRLEFFTLVDKFLNVGNSGYTPRFVKNYLVDAFRDIATATLLKEFPDYFLRDHISYISYIGDTKGVKLYTKEFTNIADDIRDNNTVVLSAGTKLYAGSNSFRLTYNIDGNSQVKGLYVNKYHNIELKNKIQVTGISGSAYIAGDDKVVVGEDIRNYIGLPLFFGKIVDFVGNNYEVSSASHIDITHYDGSNAYIDFRDTKRYELYDLGGEKMDYSMRLGVENDFYYSKIRMFRDGLFGTYSQQLLGAPQSEADMNAPELGLFDSIRVPIYQKYRFDLSPYIYEDTGIKNIKEVYIDFDLDEDSDGDGNTQNDKDFEKIRVISSLNKIEVEFGVYDTLFSQDIGITLVDTNGNIGYKKVPFVVYAPTPEITSYVGGVLKGSIDEPLDGEPVNFYRFRGGSIRKLEDVRGNLTAFTDTGDYQFESQMGESGLVLKKEDKLLGFVNEYTGKIEGTGVGTQIRVLASNDSENDGVYPKMILGDSGGDVFYQSIRVEGQENVKLVEDFSGISEEGIYVRFIDGASYNYYVVPAGLSYNPGSLSIYRNTDTSKGELFTIFRDGRVDTLNDFYVLEYKSFGEYVVYSLIDKHFNREVAQVLVRVEGDYVME